MNDFLKKIESAIDDVKHREVTKPEWRSLVERKMETLPKEMLQEANTGLTQLARRCAFATQGFGKRSTGRAAECNHPRAGSGAFPGTKLRHEAFPEKSSTNAITRR